MEFLVATSLISIIASAFFIIFNPVKKQARARDAIRKNDIAAIAGALQSYYLLAGTYPFEVTCDSSRGTKTNACPVVPGDPGYYGTWNPTSHIYVGLINTQAILKKLPKDPLNNDKYYYKYEPGEYGNNTPSSQCSSGKKCFYWIGAKLEAPSDPAKPIYRCSNLSSSDYTGSPGTGCREINTTGAQAGEINGGIQ